MERTQITYFSTFTGVGGFELGIQQAIPEAQCVGMSEIDKHASAVLKHQFPEVKNYGDITKINPEELPRFTILCGGFPCQAFSIAGKREGFNDARGTLFYELARIIKSRQPEILFFENVKGLLNHEEGRTFATIIQILDELGYDAEWQLLNSKDFGVPQNRERVIIIGYTRTKPRLQIFPFTKPNRELTKSKRIKEIQSGRQGNRVYDPNGISSTIQSIPGGMGGKTGLYSVQPILTPTRTQKRQNGRRIKEEGEPMFTLTGQDQRGIIQVPIVFDRGKIRETENSLCIDANYFKGADSHGARTHVKKDTTIRRLTPTETERLQGFPDNWTLIGDFGEGPIEMSDGHRYKQMGNAVTVNVIKAVAERIKNSIDKNWDEP